MQNIFVSRYKADNPGNGWDGVIEPADRSWILFIRSGKGPPALYLHRDISEAEAVERGLAPYDPATKLGMGGEYLPAADMPEGENPTPNRPVPCHGA